jgi:hypothetical protein
MVWYKCCSAVFVWFLDIFRQKGQETEEKQALIDPTLERETYTTQQPLLLVQGTDFVASEDLKHGIIEYANENMINIGLRETPMGARENAARARMYQRALQTVKTKLVGFTKPTPVFRNLEPGEWFASSLFIDEENNKNNDNNKNYDKQLTEKYGPLLQDAYHNKIYFKDFPSCLTVMSYEDK